MNKQKAFIDALENRKGYDYIAQRYTEYTKEELKDIILEALYQLPASRVDYMVVELADRWADTMEG